MMRAAREEKRAADEKKAREEAEARGETYVPSPSESEEVKEVKQAEEPKVYEIVEEPEAQAEKDDQPPALEQVDVEAERKAQEWADRIKRQQESRTAPE